jgi:hypothetical protein
MVQSTVARSLPWGGAVAPQRPVRVCARAVGVVRCEVGGRALGAPPAVVVVAARSTQSKHSQPCGAFHPHPKLASPVHGCTSLSMELALSPTRSREGPCTTYRN